MHIEKIRILILTNEQEAVSPRPGLPDSFVLVEMLEIEGVL